MVRTTWKNRVFCMALIMAAAVQLVVAPNCNVRAVSDDFTPPDFDYREVSEDTTQYLNEFMELSQEELSAVDPYGNGKRLDSYDPIGFDVYLSEAEVSEMLDVLAQQQGDDTDYSDNKKVFCDYLLDRIHLKGIFEAWALEETNYLIGIDLLSLRAIEDNIPFREVEVAEGSHMVWVQPMPPMAFYPVEYQGQTIWMEWKEFFMRMLYTARTYGELYFYPMELLLDDTAQYLNEFMELSLDELEDIHGDTSGNFDNSVQVSFSAYQWNQLIDEFVLQNDVPADDPMATQAAFYDLILEKLHLSGVYNAFADYEISSLDFAETHQVGSGSDPTEWKIDAEDLEYVVVDWYLNPRNITTDADGMYRLVYQDNTVAMTAYEVVTRTVYVINTYGDTDYFVEAYQTPLDKDVTDQTTTTETTTTTTVTTAATTTTAGGVATGDASVIYPVLAGIGAVAAACFTRKRKSASA